MAAKDTATLLIEENAKVMAAHAALQNIKDNVEKLNHRDINIFYKAAILGSCNRILEDKDNA